MRITLNHKLGSIEFSFTDDFDPRFLAELKASIAPEYRSYDPENHIWTILKPAVSVFRAVHKRYFIGENQTEMEF